MSHVSSITDQPVSNQEGNLLGVEDYAKALAGFMQESATPLTVGLQGQWGTGKTSLMNLIRELLDDSAIATSWVNTWEYSLFRNVEQITPAVLRGMLENLRESCGDNWTVQDDRMRNIRSFFSAAGSVASQVVKAQTGIDAAKVAGAVKQDVNTEVEIVALKHEISALIDQLVSDERNSFSRVVFFLDDLDRIDPPVAVEILEVLKNIFDIPSCIFVLAIDYDVVVKGLEKKFGKKTEANAREFRSFFDKIIQVPFSMPIGTYRIDKLFASLSEQLQLQIPEKYQNDYIRIVYQTVGVVPRSVKRFVNSYSLLIRLGASDDNQVHLGLFALLGVQISYPKIYALLAKRPEFPGWNEDFAQDLGIDLAQLAAEVGEYGELLDEPWEQLIWGVCKSDPYLRSRSKDILVLLNRLREIMGESLGEVMNLAMDASSITMVKEVDSVSGGAAFDQDERWANRQLCKALAAELNEKYSGIEFKYESAEIRDDKPLFRVYQARGTAEASVWMPVNQWTDQEFQIAFRIGDNRAVLYIWGGNRGARDYRDRWCQNNLGKIGLDVGEVKSNQRNLVIDKVEFFDDGGESVSVKFAEWMKERVEQLLSML